MKKAQNKTASSLDTLSAEIREIKQFILHNVDSIEDEATRQHILSVGSKNLRHSFIKKYRDEHIYILTEIANHLGSLDKKSSLIFFDKLGQTLAKKSIEDHLTLEEAVNGSIFLKQAIWRQVERKGLLAKITAEEMYLINQQIGTYIDTIGSKLAFEYHNGYLKKFAQEVAERKIIENNLFFLSETSKVLSSSLDYKTTLINVAKLAVAEIADWCSVTIKTDTTLEQLVVAHTDPEKMTWAEKLREKMKIDPKDKRGVPNVIRTGKSELYPQITQEQLEASAKNKEELEILQNLQMTSVMIIPLVLHGKAIGAISFISAESKRHYTQNDVIMAEEVASRMALAIENARLYSESKSANELQKRLAAIVESSDDAIIGKSVDGLITSWNKGAQQLYGYSADEIIGKSVSILMPDDKKDEFPMIMKQLQNNKKFEHYETKRKTKDGKILDVSITVSAIRDDTGKIIGASKVARNISEQKIALERQQFLEQVSTILGTSIDYETTLKNLGKIIVPYLADYCRIVVLDDNGQIKEIALHHKDRKLRPLIKKLYDAYKDDETPGVTTLIKSGKSEIIPELTPDLLSQASELIQEIIKQLHLQSYMGIPMKIGNKIVGAITFSSTSKERIYTKDDLTLGEELARRAALAIENAQLYAKAQKAITLRDDFISVASHELKTPITSLKMYEQILQQQFAKRGETDLLKYFVKMDDQINKLNLLIGDLLNVTKLEHGKLEFTMEAFSLQEVIGEVIESIQQTTKKHQLIFKGEVHEKVYADKYRIHQVITNLLNNAVKYSPNADKVVIRLTAKHDYAVVSVQDFGIGIDKTHLTKLFDQFYRVASPEEKTFPGLGIGLYIAKQIVTRHKGTLTVQSHKGKGSIFSFTLPFEKQTSGNTN